MKKKWNLFILIVLASGCASQGLYEWGNYDESLYKYYKNAENEDKLFSSLEVLISDSDNKSNLSRKPIAPGLYAEYGYLLFERGRYQEAVLAFAEEKKRYPESSLLMDKMIKSAYQQSQERSY